MTVVALGVLAGFVAGFFGVGGGILFVPALTLALGMGAVEAEATSLMAIIPVAIVGTISQHRYGNVRFRDALLIGVLAAPAALLGVVIVNHLPEHAVRIAFAALLVFTAYRLARSPRDGIS